LDYFIFLPSMISKPIYWHDEGIIYVIEARRGTIKIWFFFYLLRSLPASYLSLFISLIFMFLSNSLLVKLGILKWRSCFNFPASFNQKMILKEENIEGERTSHRAQVQTQF